MSSLLLAATIYGQSVVPSGNAVGDMQYWNGASWALIPAGKPGQILTVSTDNVPVWQYPQHGTMTDIDGNIYNTIRIGNQEWTVENLRTTRLNDGTAIPNVTDDAAWSALTNPGYCLYNNDGSNKMVYGALYNWYAVNTSKLAPKGWHVPTDAEWDTLQNYLIAHGYNWDGTTTGNKIAKSLAAKTDWIVISDTAAFKIPVGGVGKHPGRNNISGFSALGSGYRCDKDNYDQSVAAYWWSATEADKSNTSGRLIDVWTDDLVRFRAWPKNWGFSVRLVRD